MTQPNASLLKSRKHQRPESNRNDALTVTPDADASGSLRPRQPQLAESLTRPHGTHAMQRTMFLAITILALATHLSWAQTPTIEPAVTPPAPPTAEKTESPPPVVDDAAVEAKLVDSELLKREMLKLVGRWKLTSTSVSEQNIKIDDSDGMEVRRHGDKLEATFSQRGVNKSFTAMLTVSDAPERIRRIKFVEKQFNDEPQTAMAVYEISDVDGENDNPLRLIMNISKRGNYPASMDERGEGIHQLEFEHVVPREGALGLPASAIPGKVWITSGTAIVAIADDGKSATAYCEKHPTWVSIQLDSTITAQPKPVADTFDVAVQHGPQCHAYSMSLGTWSTLTLPAGEEAVANLDPIHSGASVDFKAHSNVSVHSKTQGDYVFKDRWGKWFSAEEIKAGKVAEHLATLMAKSGETGAPSVNITKVFPLQNDQAKAATELLKQLYDSGPVKIAMDARTNSVIVSGPIAPLAEIEALLLKLDAAEPVAIATTATPISSEAAKQIAQLEDERVILLQGMGDQHPKVLELDARLAQARSRLVESAPSTPNNLLRRDLTASSAGDAIYRKELLMLAYLQDTLSELKKELDEIIQKEGKDHPDVAHLQASVAEEEAKVQKLLAEGKVASEQVIAVIEETVGEMKQFLERLPKGVEGMREERNNLVKYDPQNPRIRELDKGIAALKATGRYYFDLVAAIEAGQVTPFLPAIVPLTNAIEVSASYSKQISQLRKDYEAAEAEAQRLAEQLRQPGSTASKDELRKTVERAFTLRQSLLRAELGEMLDRLAKTQHSIDMRDQISDQIVTRRVEELLNPQLEWDESKSGTQPAPPSDSPMESAPSQPQEWTAKLQGQWQLTQHVYEEVDTSDGKQPAPDDIKRENWSPETYYRIKKIPMKAMFDGNRVSACMEDGSDQMTFELSFRKAGPPLQVDLTMELSPADLAELKQMDEETRSSTTLPTFQGIIEETSDGFRLCLDTRMKGNRPFLFVLGPDTALWEFLREASSSPVSAPARVTDEEAPVQSESKPAEEKRQSPSKTETAKAGQMTAKQLTLLFMTILERRPTDREEEAWLNSMRTGQSATDVVSTLLANNQVFNQVDRDKAGYIKHLHRILMDRNPTAEELTYWTGRYDELQGIRSDVAREFVNSTGTAEEFLSRLRVTLPKGFSESPEQSAGPPAEVEGKKPAAAPMGEG